MTRARTIYWLQSILLNHPRLYKWCFATPIYLSVPYRLRERRISITIGRCEQMDYAQPMTCANRRWPTLIRSANRETDCGFANLPSDMYACQLNRVSYLSDWSSRPIIKYEKINRQISFALYGWIFEFDDSSSIKIRVYEETAIACNKYTNTQIYLNHLVRWTKYFRLINISKYR